MTQLLLGLLCVLGLAVVFLWLKLKKATLSSDALKGETEQRVASDELKIKVELARREDEKQEKVTDAQDAINRRADFLKRMSSQGDN